MLSLTDVWKVKTKIEIFISDDLTDEHIAKLLVHQLRTALGDRYERVVSAMITEHQSRDN
jgi:hypothetical protein